MLLFGKRSFFIGGTFVQRHYRREKGGGGVNTRTSFIIVSVLSLFTVVSPPTPSQFRRCLLQLTWLTSSIALYPFTPESC